MSSFYLALFQYFTGFFKNIPAFWHDWHSICTSIIRRRS